MTGRTTLAPAATLIRAPSQPPNANPTASGKASAQSMRSLSRKAGSAKKVKSAVAITLM